MLNLSYGHVGPEGARHLATLLAAGCSLTALRLDGCGLGTDGAAAIADALSGPTATPLRALRIEVPRDSETRSRAHLRASPRISRAG